MPSTTGVITACSCVPTACITHPRGEAGTSNATNVLSHHQRSLCVAIERFEQVHQGISAKMPFVSFNEDPDALYPGSLNSPFLKEWSRKYGSEGAAGI